MALTELIASLVKERVLVFGSLPPQGRDLDLLVRAREARSLAAGLAAHGFERRGRVWARFRACGAEVVELVPADSWCLGPEELEALFRQATPIDDSGRVCKPAPHHTLLILARRAIREGPRLRARRRTRIALELESEPEAFEHARTRAALWGASRSLQALEAAYRDDEPIPLALRRAAVREERGRSGAAGMVAGWRSVLRRPRGGALIAISGLDGSGKSSQATYLAEALDRLGFESAVSWTSIASQPTWLAAVANTVKRALRPLAHRRSAEVPSELDLIGGSNDPAKVMRQRSAVLTFGWSMIVTLRLAASVARATWLPLMRGKVVVCDRYLLDARTHLAYQYGAQRSFRLQRALIALVSPRPRAAYLLDVDPQTAAARKPEYNAEQNEQRARIYRQLASVLGVTVVDGQRPADEICADLARASWRALA